MKTPRFNGLAVANSFGATASFLVAGAISLNASRSNAPSVLEQTEGGQATSASGVLHSGISGKTEVAGEISTRAVSGFIQKSIPVPGAVSSFVQEHAPSLKVQNQASVQTLQGNFWHEPVAAPAALRPYNAFDRVAVTIKAVDLVDTQNGRTIEAHHIGVPSSPIPFTLYGTRGAEIHSWQVRLPNSGIASGRYDGILLATSLWSTPTQIKAAQAQTAKARLRNVKAPAVQPDGTAATLSIPFHIFVRDSPFPAAILLLGSVLLYQWFHYTRTKLSQDDLLNWISERRELLRQDPQLGPINGPAKPFRDEFAQLMRAFATAVAEDDAKESEILPIQAKIKTLWQRWSANPKQWVAGLTLATKQLKRLEGPLKQAVRSQESNSHVETLQKGLQDLYENAPTSDQNAPQFLKAVFQVSHQVDRYFALAIAVTAARDETEGVEDPDRQSAIRNALNQVLQQWQNLGNAAPEEAAPEAVPTVPSLESFDPLNEKQDENAYNMLANYVADLRLSIAPLSKGRANERRESFLPSVIPTPPGPIVAPDDDDFVPLRLLPRLRAAQKTSFVYSVVFVVVMCVLLLWLGFEQTYNNNPAFGAQPWRDYLAVALWGLGVNFVADASAGVAANAPFEMTGGGNVDSPAGGTVTPGIPMAPEPGVGGSAGGVADLPPEVSAGS